MPFIGQELERVVVVESTPSDARRVQAIGLFTDGVALWWIGPNQTTTRHDDPAAMMEGMSLGFGLTDDIGTSYEMDGGSAGGVGQRAQWTRGMTHYTPPVPAEAAQLLITSPDGVTTVAL